ncbi:Ig-like domain-containing protein, partial [Streptococcus salivarius]|uniref:Ig-like domain-containing protein n=1 Tax=Streptococcus salivarius TaxID=1304 RepID=UPI000A743977
SAEPGSKVELFDKDGNKIGEATADENGKATITPTVAIPAGNVTAKATDPAGNTSDASDPMVATTDTTAPAKPVVNTDLTGKAGTKTPVEVSAEPGSKVELFDKDGNKIGEATADENGKATITPTVAIPAGNVTAKATDPAGNTSDASDPMVATTDTTAPAKPVVNPVKAGDTAVTGTAEAGSTVEVTLPDGTKVSAIADQDGNFSVPVSGLKEGDQVSVTATDNAGNKSPETDITVASGAPSVTEVVDLSNLTEAEKEKVSEEVRKVNRSAREIKVSDDGTAIVTFPDGSSVTYTPAQTIKKADTTAPAKPVVNTDLTGKAGTKTPVEVSAEPGSKVELFDKDGNKIGEATADENGKATIT